MLPSMWLVLKTNKKISSHQLSSRTDPNLYSNKSWLIAVFFVFSLPAPWIVTLIIIIVVNPSSYYLMMVMVIKFDLPAFWTATFIRFWTCFWTQLRWWWWWSLSLVWHWWWWWLWTVGWWCNDDDGDDGEGNEWWWWWWTVVTFTSSCETRSVEKERRIAFCRRR